MKRLISLVLICLLLFGCTPRQQDTGIRFCYPRKDYIYSVTGGSVAWETRDVTQEDLSYLLRLYLLGPQDEDLEALYPADIRLESASVAGGTVTVTLSPVGNRLTWPEPALSSPAPPPSSSKAETAAWPWTGTA